MRTVHSLRSFIACSAWFFAVTAGCSSGDEGSATPPGAGGAGGAAGTAGAAQGGSAGSATGKGGSAGSGAAGKGGGAAGGAGGSGGAGAGAGGSGGCEAASDCEALLPKTSPTGCAEALCEAGACVFKARDKDGDGKASKFCKDAAGEVKIELGNDCDDGDKTRYPGAWDGPEGEGNEASCDGVDNDCSGAPDDGVLADGTSCACKPGSTQKCAQTSAGKPIAELAGGEVGECRFGSQKCVIDDATGVGKWGPCTGAIGPVAEECNGGKDDDCDGSADEEDAVNQQQWGYDGDGDNYGSSLVAPVISCNPPPVPANCEKISLNCDPSRWKPKTSLAALNTDCNDMSPDASPGNTSEACTAATKGLDDDCDGAIDDGCECVSGESQSCLQTSDGKPIPSENGAPIGACKAGTRECNGGKWGPCNNSVGSKPETCDNAGSDDDCDGTVDNDPAGVILWFCDADGDGQALKGAPGKLSCPGKAPDAALCTFTDSNGQIHQGTWSTSWPLNDCNDADQLISSNAQELCNSDGIDEDCDGDVNEGCGCNDNDPPVLCWVANGVSIPHQGSTPIGACVAGIQVCKGGKLEPCINGVGPGIETCSDEGVDNDCDGDADEIPDSAPFWYCDADGDTQLAPSAQGVKSCNAPSSPACGGAQGVWTTVVNKTDCDDTRADVKIGALEICDSDKVDENCNNQKNEGCECSDGEIDNACSTDAQGPITWPGGAPVGGFCKYGVRTCSGGVWSPCTGAQRPVPESCANPGQDNDCDGAVDNNPSAQSTWYCDADGDGELDLDPLKVKKTATCAAYPPDPCDASGCDLPGNPPCGSGKWLPTDSVGYTDCNDNDSEVGKFKKDVCDGKNNDCAGSADDDPSFFVTFYCDADNDGHVAAAALTQKACPGTALPAGSCKSSGLDALPGTKDDINGQWLNSPQSLNDCGPDNPFRYPGAWDGPAHFSFGVRLADGSGGSGWLRTIRKGAPVFSGAFVEQKKVHSVQHSWSGGAPFDPGGSEVNADQFTIRWEGEFVAPSPTTCAKTSENQSMLLGCPAGQSIQDVTFATYGNSTAQCGSLWRGSCDADVASKIKTLCVGKNACAVDATNANFGDPCAGTAKNLIAQVTCGGSNAPAVSLPYSFTMSTTGYAAFYLDTLASSPKLSKISYGAETSQSTTLQLAPGSVHPIRVDFHKTPGTNVASGGAIRMYLSGPGTSGTQWLAGVTNPYPEGPQVNRCDGVDNDCDGLPDDDRRQLSGGSVSASEGCGAPCGPDQTEPCTASNKDNIGICRNGVIECQINGSWSTCKWGVLPLAADVCGDGKNNDCDGQTDEPDGQTTQYCRDNDDDGYGDLSTCAIPATCPPPGLPWKPRPALLNASGTTDCNDNNKFAFSTSAPEVCDGQDNNCAGGADEGAACEDEVCFNNVPKLVAYPLAKVGSGNTDFSGHGPGVTMRFEVSNSTYALALKNCSVNMKESVSDFTEGNFLESDCSNATNLFLSTTPSKGSGIIDVLGVKVTTFEMGTFSKIDASNWRYELFYSDTTVENGADKWDINTTDNGLTLSSILQYRCKGDTPGADVCSTTNGLYLSDPCSGCELTVSGCFRVKVKP